jgi:hypothetical protein
MTDEYLIVPAYDLTQFAKWSELTSWKFKGVPLYNEDLVGRFIIAFFTVNTFPTKKLGFADYYPLSASLNIQKFAVLAVPDNEPIYSALVPEDDKGSVDVEGLPELYDWRKEELEKLNKAGPSGQSPRKKQKNF